jgi:hypothetical protein
MTLLQIQRQMAHSLLQPLGSGTEAGYLKPNDRLTAAERLEIYARSYWFRLLDCLYDDFPGLRALLGQKAFHEMSRCYLAECPSRSFTLRNLGARLEGWLWRHPEHAGKNPDLALDMVRLEWAHVEAFDNASEKVLGPEDLLEIGPDFRCRIQPYVRLLSLRYPADDLRLRVNDQKKRLPRVRPQQIYVAVHRLDYTDYYRRLAPEEHRLLSALSVGKPIGQAIGSAFENSSVVDPAALLEQWFGAWCQLGWLCRPKRGKISK